MARSAASSGLSDFAASFAANRVDIDAVTCLRTADDGRHSLAYIIAR